MHETTDQASTLPMNEQQGPTFEVNQEHILERLAERYQESGEPQTILDRVLLCLQKHTPRDWRFTESPASRFFIMDEASGAKFMGLSYRYSDVLHKLLEEIQGACVKSTEKVWPRLGEYVKSYTEEVLNPGLPILHDLRTVYPLKEGSLSEEKKIYKSMREAITHVVPIEARKIGSRPNAIVSGERELWVRQYMNWLGSGSGGKEYFFFHPLVGNGVVRSRFRVWSLSDQGHLKQEYEDTLDCDEVCKIFSQCKSHIKKNVHIRSESYWKVPTNLDRRWIDLDFRRREALKSAQSETSEPLNGSEIAELAFLEHILDKARQKLHKK